MGRLHTCYSPVRRSPANRIATIPAAPRLACVKPVASVHPEPGSNSSLLYLVFYFFKKSKTKFYILILPSRFLRNFDASPDFRLKNWLELFALVLLLVYCKSFNVRALSCSRIFASRKLCKGTTIFWITKIFWENFLFGCHFSAFLCFSHQALSMVVFQKRVQR